MLEKLFKFESTSYEIVRGPSKVVIVDDRTVRYGTNKYLSLGNNRNVRNGMWGVLGYANERVVRVLRDTPVWDDYLREVHANEEYFLIVEEVNPTLHRVVSVFTDEEYFDEVKRLHSSVVGDSDWNYVSIDEDNDIISYYSRTYDRYIQLHLGNGFISDINMSQELFQLNYDANLIGRRSSYYLFESMIDTDDYVIDKSDLQDITDQLTVGEAEQVYKYLFSTRKIDENSFDDFYSHSSFENVDESDEMIMLRSIFDTVLDLRDHVDSVEASKYSVVPDVSFYKLLTLINREVYRLISVLADVGEDIDHLVDLALRVARANEYVTGIKVYNAEIRNDIISQVN